MPTQFQNDKSYSSAIRRWHQSWNSAKCSYCKREAGVIYYSGNKVACGDCFRNKVDEGLMKKYKQGRYSD